jgi:DNA-binding transcriptional MocR family regulator
MSNAATAIATRLEAEIREGRLAPGARLPTHRQLARQHGVALNTASNAMRLLTVRGLIVGEVGRGSFVRAPHHVDADCFELQAPTPGTIDLARNVMPLPGLTERFEQAARAVLRRERDELADYPPNAGRMADRVAAAGWMSRNGHLPNDPSQVLICAGAQHAISVALMTLAKPGDAIAVDALTWPGIKAIAAAIGLELVPIPMDGEGMRPRALLRLAQRRRITALYCMPSLQNPTAATMSTARRETLAALARRLDFQIIEDDAYGFLSAPDLPPLASLAPERSWYIRTLAKSLLPGLRTAWLLAPADRVGRAAELMRATIWATPSLGPAIASYWIANGTAAALERERRQEASARQRIAASLLATETDTNQSSMHLWLPLPQRLRAQEMVERAASAGIRITPSGAFGVGHTPNAVRLSLCAPPARSELKRALRILTTLFS